MTNRHVLVKNIKVNNNEPFEMKLPVVHSGFGGVAKNYIRTFAFHFTDVTYDFEEVPASHWLYHTETEVIQPCYPDLIDNQDYYHKEFVSAKVLPMPQTSMLLWITDQDLADVFEYGMEQAVFEKLMMYLPVDFFVDESPQENPIDKLVSDKELEVFDEVKKISETADNEWRTKVYNNIIYCMNVAKGYHEDRKLFDENEEDKLLLDRLTEDDFRDMFTVIDTILVD